MPDRYDSGVSIERMEDLSIVSLKVSRKSLEESRDRLQLASPLQATGSDPRSLWLGPDRWLLVSGSTPSDSIIEKCKVALGRNLYSAVDYSAGLMVLRVAGPDAGQLLATGSGLDFRPGKFPVGTCYRTRLAQVAAVIVSETPGQFDVYIDRSYGTYLNDWLTEASSICARAVAFQA